MKFLNCQINLGKRVFIPRMETEFWLKRALKNLSTINRRLEILDIFAGSGCIGIAILKNMKNSFVEFADIDQVAIEQIKINLRLNKISPQRYKIYKSDLFKKLKKKKYDIIFANPPYVAKERLGEVQESVKKREPKISWYGEKMGLKYIKKFLREAKAFLKEKGMIYLEFDPLQKEKIKEILKNFKYKRFKFYKDQFQKFRWLKIF